MRIGFRKRVRLSRNLSISVGKTLIPSMTVGRKVRLSINKRGVFFGATLGFGFFLIQQLFKWRKR
ncbi:hypothetical protein CU102_12520 [Phyllobacterium brassicacearum]|uniref:Uncharacterized protein n=1 Tax=Phyllobacterium brassicacearum TaxID=314235 RepID=A0A2P7BQ72_9HYPH|nr:hypothetical protein [Phyllobacterium brassicacearum]PSH68582.1 hypothetical protein CU102_12520 [Phyllobacterium brassicacearum]TDQ24129.1 hypothetical protein DEV91_1157 [Phyllobacterium brassicacearum]